jgi:acyl-CoA hydrolase
MTLTATNPVSSGVDFSAPASDETIFRTAAALRARGFDVLIADDREDARHLALSLIPDGAEVNEGASVTLDQLGISEDIRSATRFSALKPRIYGMDRATQMKEIRQLGSAPDVIVGSVHAITEDGQVVVASGSGSQLAGYASGAGQVIWVVGSQKIVPDLESAMLRITEHAFPLEDARALATYGVHSALLKLLIVNGERPGRITVVLLREAIGF